MAMRILAAALFVCLTGLCLPAQADDFPKTYTLTVERDGSISIDKPEWKPRPPSAPYARYAPDEVVEKLRELMRLERKCKARGRAEC